MRIKFKKNQQRNFIKKVLENSGCLSLGELCRRLNLNYSTMKNYFSERRVLPNLLFENLCLFGNLKKENFNFQEFSENWGQIKGGKISRKF